MPAYWVARAKITDPVQYKKYTDLVPAIIAKHGGKVLARGGRYEILEGPEKFHRFVVIEFPTFEQGVACFKSDEYNKAAAFRSSLSTTTIRASPRRCPASTPNCWMSTKWTSCSARTRRCRPRPPCRW